MFIRVVLVFVALIPLATRIHGADNERVYTITVGRTYGAQYYRNEYGISVGFLPELIAEVCQEAGISCVISDINRAIGRCWTSSAGMHPYGGRGLHGKWFDGCSGRDPTVERIHVFAFSTSYTKNAHSLFFFLQGSNFDGRDLAGKKIGFFIGWSSNEQCVARQEHIANRKLKPEQMFFMRKEQAETFLKNRTVDAVLGDIFAFSPQELEDANMDYDRNVKLNCFLGGNAVMTRKDSTLIPNWNVGFNKLVNTGRFRKLCEEAEKKHGHRGDVNCVDT